MANESTPQFDKGYVEEAFFSPDARIDLEAGVLSDALIFGPKAKEGQYYRGASGLYSENFFKSLSTAVEGAYSWPYHPEVSDGKVAARKVSDAIGRWKGTKFVVEAGQPRVRGTFKLRNPKKNEFIDLVSEGADRFAFSIFGPTVRKYDRDIGEYVHWEVDTESRRKFSVDLVEAGGANDTIFESAQDTTDSKKPKEEEMTKEEVQALLDEHDKKARAEVLESIKPQLEESKKVVDENKVLKRRQLVAETLREAKLDEKYVSEAFRKTLDTCAEEDLAGLIQDRKQIVAQSIDPIKDAGGDATQKDKGMTSEQAVEVLSARGLHTVVAEMAGKGFAQEADKDRAFAREWMDKIGRRIANKRDQSKETKELRSLVKEQYGNVGIRNLFAQFYGTIPMTENDMSVLPTYQDDRAIPVSEAAIASTGFSALNATVLASVVIEAFNEATGLVADQLTREYRTNKETENVPGFDEPSDLSNVSEGAEKPDATLANKYVTLQTITKRAEKVTLTREAVFFDRTGQLLDRANRIGINAMLDRETQLIKGIIDDPAFRCYYPSGAVSPLWTATNTEEANALVDYTDIENAVKRLSRQVDSLSRRLRDNVMTPLEILMPYELWITAQKIFGAEMFETAPGSTNNIRFRNAFGTTRLYPSQVLDGINTSTWYIAGAGGFRRQYLRKVTFPLEVVPVPAAEIGTVIKDLVGGVAVMYSERVFATQNVRVVRNYATALS